MATSQNTTPELLYLLHGDPTELAEALGGMRAADVAEALRDLPPDAAAKVMAALPFDLAVQVFDEPELERHRCEIIERMGEKAAAPLIDAMSADQQADLFRELPEASRGRVSSSCSTRRRARRCSSCSRYRAGHRRRNHDDGVRLGADDWTVEQALDHISDGRPERRRRSTRSTCSIRTTRALVHVVVAARSDAAPIARSTVVDGRQPAQAARRCAARPIARKSRGLISKYNLLAVPVVDEGEHMLGIVTVDDVIDAIVREQTEDVQKFGGMEALDEPYTEICFATHDQEARGVALRALPRRDADRDGDGALRGRDREGGRAGDVHPARSSARAATRDRRRRR